MHMVRYGMTDTFSSRAGTTNYFMSAGEREREGESRGEGRGEESDSLSDWYMFISYVHYFLAWC
jgi:hypothetical protein